VVAARRAGALLFLALIVLALAIDVLNSGVPTGVDFHTYEAAAQVGLQQGWGHIYDQALVADQQKRLVPDQLTQAFLSPPTVAWAAAALTPLPYWWSYYLWAAMCLAAYTASVAWSATSRGFARWVAIAAAVAPASILYAVHLGQVVPLVAAAVIVAWRLVREERHVAAGLVLALILLKPNTAFVVPFALLAAGRYRTFAAWIAAAAGLTAIALVTLGTHGTSAYVSELTGQLPSGAAWLTLEGALGLSGAIALSVRLAIAAGALAAAFWWRDSPGVVIAAGILGSLLVTPYLHAADLCLLVAAAWMIWGERPALAWRIPMGAGWLAASPIAAVTGLAPTLSRWTLVELGTLVALLVTGCRSWLENRRTRPHSRQPLTGEADLRTQGPA
jgi:hypothetical protein